jgi:hypothetical protein
VLFHPRGGVAAALRLTKGTRQPNKRQSGKIGIMPGRFFDLAASSRQVVVFWADQVVPEFGVCGGSGVFWFQSFGSLPS